MASCKSNSEWFTKEVTTDEGVFFLIKNALLCQSNSYPQQKPEYPLHEFAISQSANEFAFSNQLVFPVSLYKSTYPPIIKAIALGFLCGAIPKTPLKLIGDLFNNCV